MTDTLVRGIVLEEVGDRIVVQASPTDVQRFAPQTEVGIRRFAWTAPMPPEPGDMLYNANGRPVARVTDVHLFSETVDITTIQDTVRVVMPVRRRFTITAGSLLP